MQKIFFSLLIVCFTLLSGLSYGASTNRKNLNTENLVEGSSSSFSGSAENAINLEETAVVFGAVCFLHIDRVVTNEGPDGTTYTTVFYHYNCYTFNDPVLF